MPPPPPPPPPQQKDPSHHQGGGGLVFHGSAHTDNGSGAHNHNNNILTRNIDATPRGYYDGSRPHPSGGAFPPFGAGLVLGSGPDAHEEGGALHSASPLAAAAAAAALAAAASRGQPPASAGASPSATTAAAAPATPAAAALLSFSRTTRPCLPASMSPLFMDSSRALFTNSSHFGRFVNLYRDRDHHQDEGQQHEHAPHAPGARGVGITWWGCNGLNAVYP
jgi:hypothetical protein